MKAKTFFTLFLLQVLCCVNAQQHDSITGYIPSPDSLYSQKRDEISPSFIQKIIDGKLNFDFVIAPLIAYQTETNWTFGLAGSYFIKPKNNKGRTGLIWFNAEYSLNKQFNFIFNSTVYLGKSQRLILFSQATYKYYPDQFFGVGNSYSDLLLDSNNSLYSIPYISNNLNILIQPQYFVWKNWILGLSANFKSENMTEPQNPDIDKYNLAGMGKYIMVGLGGVVSYDSRNNFFYPSKGMFFKTYFTFFDKAFGSKQRLTKLSIDYRHFVSVYKDLIFAYQVVGEANFSEQKFYGLLPTFGGNSILRGFRSMVWTDNVMYALQTELRIPVWRFIKAAAFCSIGDVNNFDHWKFVKPKFGYGVGLRVQFNNSKAHLRFDVARQNYDNQFYWYFTVNEAF